MRAGPVVWFSWREREGSPQSSRRRQGSGRNPYPKGRVTREFRAKTGPRTKPGCPVACQWRSGWGAGMLPGVLATTARAGGRLVDGAAVAVRPGVVDVGVVGVAGGRVARQREGRTAVYPVPGGHQHRRFPSRRRTTGAGSSTSSPGRSPGTATWGSCPRRQGDAAGVPVLGAQSLLPRAQRSRTLVAVTSAASSEHSQATTFATSSGCATCTR